MKITIIKDCKIYSNNPRQFHNLKKDCIIEASDTFAKRLIELNYGKNIEDNNEELEALKEKAMKLEIKFHANIGIEKLKAKIEAKEKALPTLENKAITNLNNK